DDLVADIDADHLVLGGGAPVYYRDTSRPNYLAETGSFDLESLPDLAPDDVESTILQILASPNIASKRWVYEQYDTTVRTNTAIGPGPSDPAVIRIKGTPRALALKTDCNGRWVYLNPRKGAQAAVAEAARNVVCAGGKPVAITNCLNFGNPYKPEVYWVFKEAVTGMGEACEAFGTPVTGGNVSFYNESPEGAVFPTPTIGMLGLIDDADRDATTIDLKSVGDDVWLLTPASWRHARSITGSEYLAVRHSATAGDAPYLDLEEEKVVQETMLALIRAGLVQSAHDVSDGGLATCLAEKVLTSRQGGADIDLEVPEAGRLDAILFGEDHSRIVFTTSSEDSAAVLRIAKGCAGVQLTRIGATTTAERLRIRLDGQVLVHCSSEKLLGTYEGSIPSRMETL
ncbi:MAG: AIR synthase related protein, partial [Rhodothermia bacterium]